VAIVADVTGRACGCGEAARVCGKCHAAEVDHAKEAIRRSVALASGIMAARRSAGRGSDDHAEHEAWLEGYEACLEIFRAELAR